MSHTFFHPEAGKPVSSFNTSPQVSGKGRMLHSFSVHSFYPTFQFQCFHFNACGDTKTIFSVGACEKTSVNPPVDMYLTSATQSQLDKICYEAYQLVSHTLRISQTFVRFQLIGHPHYDGFVSGSGQLCSTNFPKVKGALNESSMLVLKNFILFLVYSLFLIGNGVSSI